MSRGGKRRGAGRKIGSNISFVRKLLRETLTPKQQLVLLQKAYKKAVDGDKDLLKFFLEQIFGRAPQPVDMNTRISLDRLITQDDLRQAIESEPPIDEDYIIQ